MSRSPHQTPQGPLRILSSFCPTDLHEGIEGDLVEKYDDDVTLYGHKRATRRLWWNVIRFVRPSIILRNKFTIELIAAAMIRNYLTVAFRNVIKNKIFSSINIFGLSIGLAACLLILQFVMYELSYDKFHDKADRIYRVTNDRFQHGKLIQHGTIMYPTIGPAMAQDFPEVEQYSRLMPVGEINVKVDGRFYRGDNCHFADDHFFSIFSFPLLAGTTAEVLKGRYKIVLTESTARKYFQLTDKNYTSILGKYVYWGLDANPYIVSGVCSDVPENSHIQFNALVSYETLITPEQHGADDSWTWSDMRHYLLLKPGVSYKMLESKFEKFAERHFQGDKISGSVEKFYLQPLKDAHLYSDYEYDIAKTASGKAVWSMIIVAAFILLIAYINYINLTTSKAIERAKEVGLRKVMGAAKGQLVKQFIIESSIISLCAFLFGLLLTALLQSPFNKIVGSTLSPLKVISNTESNTLVVITAVMVFGVILSGFYPAFILSSYQPITVLKGKFQRSSRGNILRKGLVIFQFMASAALITGTLIVSRQLKYMNNADLGINLKNTMIVEAPENTAWDSTFIQRVESYLHELSTLPDVVSSSSSNRIPGTRLGRAFNIRLDDQPDDTKVTMSFMGVDYHFFDTYNLSVLSGRKFIAGDHNTDMDKVENIVLNVSAINLLGIKNAEEAIGKKISFWDRSWTIVGVFSNFHQEALMKPLEPLLFLPSYSTGSRTSIKIKPGNTESAIAAIERTYNKFFPSNSFEYFFLEDFYQRQYNDDQRFGKVVNIFAVLAIIISCLGLIGLSSYTAVQRTKEIGIRKVLGASTTGIVSLLSMDFLKLILIASLLALPISYFALDNWLQSYAYRIPLAWVMFALPVLSIMVIAGLTMSVQIIRTAATNPADTLKCE
ncbi:MAG: ABC transporter permease [Chryseolinea sp.]